MIARLSLTARLTLLFTLGSLVLTVGFALLLAGLMQPLKRGIGVYRGIYFMPVIASMVSGDISFLNPQIYFRMLLL